MIHKVSVRASEFQSHSKASGDVVTTSEEDSAKIVEKVLSEIDAENTPIPVDAEWDNW